MIKKTYANQSRVRRHQRVRKKIAGTAARPRLSVFRSANQIYAQVVDDERRQTLVAASSRDPELAEMERREPAPATAMRAAPKAAEPEPAPAAAAAAASGGDKRKSAPKTEPAAPAAPPRKRPSEDAEAGPVGLAGIAGNRRVWQARLVGKLIAQRAKARGIERVVFDRGGYLYHGRVAALATGAREGGLEF
jgi:ribosomal protein L18